MGRSYAICTRTTRAPAAGGARRDRQVGRLLTRIHIVEDQDDLRAILSDLLTGSGYAIVEAVDGAEAVTKAQSEQPDLILMDIQLPVVDGYEATRRIKSTSFIAPLPPSSPAAPLDYGAPVARGRIAASPASAAQNTVSGAKIRALPPRPDNHRSARGRPFSS
jgi:CheY-like chemotaxis protein